MKFTYLFLILSAFVCSNSFAQSITSSEELEKQLSAPSLGATRSLGGSQGFAGSGNNTGRADLGAIQFEYNSTELTSAGKTQVAELAKAMESLQSETFKVVGHTDASGSDSYNMTLSERRARAVVDILSSQYGIEGNRLRFEGRGESSLLETSNPNSPANRRVEIVNDRVSN